MQKKMKNDVFPDRISPIRLPQQGELVAVGSDLTVSGWGVTETSSSIVDNLLFAGVHSISNLQCAAVYGTNVIIDSTICTQGNPIQSPCNVSESSKKRKTYIL